MMPRLRGWSGAVPALLALCGCGGEGAAPRAAGAGGVAGAGGTASGGGGAGGAAGAALDGPALLSLTGLYADVGARALAPGVVEYAVRYPLWTDGAEKRRYLWLPPGTTIDTTAPDAWRFPVGTRVWKDFSRDGRLLETRLLEKRSLEPDGWWMMAYLWRDDATDAEARPSGAADVGGTQHDVPSQEDCLRCHATAVPQPLGGTTAREAINSVEWVQLSVPGGLGALQAAGWVEGGLAPVDPPGDGVVEDALGWLHGNCGNCHAWNHPLAAQRELRLRLRSGDATPEQTGAYTTAVGRLARHASDAGGVLLVAPGDAMASQLYLRISTRDTLQMPPLGSEQVDPTGMQSVAGWISALTP